MLGVETGMINSTTQYGLSGMQSAYQGMTRAATDIAGLNNRTQDAGADINAAIGGYAQPLVELHTNLTLFDASANVVSTADDLIGALLDVTA